jgi:catechol 2,3-dioxygenase-like lactoylglutathione lyase family enzyme
MRNAIKLTIPALLVTAAVLAVQEIPRPRIVGVPHVAVRVHDIEASRHFYKDFLGYSEPFSSRTDGKLLTAFIKINDRQYVELAPETSPNEPRFIHFALETDNAEGLRQYMKSKGYKVSDNPAAPHRNRNIGTPLEDPDGNHIDVTQYALDSETMKDVGKDMSDKRISTRLLHVGFYVAKRETAHYYMDILGFREFWRATADGKTARGSRQAPDPPETVLRNRRKPRPPGDRSPQGKLRPAIRVGRAVARSLRSRLAALR